MGFLDDLGNTVGGWVHGAVHAVGAGVDDVAHGAERAIGTGVDEVAHAGGPTLDDVGLHSARHWLDHVGDIVADRLGATPGEKNLGETDEAKDLVHGDTGAIYDVSSKLAGLAIAFGDTASALQRIDTWSWTGKSAEAFHSVYRKNPEEWHNAEQACTDAVAKLKAYASTVHWAQLQAGMAITQFDQMKAAMAAKASEAAVKEHAMAAATTLSSARKERNIAAVKAATAIRKAAELAPQTPSSVARMLATGQYMALSGEHTFGGVLLGFGSMVRTVRSLDPFDPHNVSNPAQWMASVTGLAAGLADVGAHPLHLVHGVIGTGWGAGAAAVDIGPKHGGTH